jgi:hypothetical protein
MRVKAEKIGECYQISKIQINKQDTNRNSNKGIRRWPPLEGRPYLRTESDVLRNWRFENMVEKRIARRSSEGLEEVDEIVKRFDVKERRLAT